MADESNKEVSAQDGFQKKDSIDLKTKDAVGLLEEQKKKSLYERATPKQLKKWFLDGFWKEVIGEGSNEAKNAFMSVYDSLTYDQLMPTEALTLPPRLEGTASDCLVQAIQALEGADRLYLREYVAVTIAATLYYLELRNEGSAENRVDLIIMPLVQNKLYPDPGLAGCEFLAALEATLRSAKPRRLSEGYCKTWGILADWASRSGYPANRAWAVSCYIRMLTAILAQVQADLRDGKGLNQELLNVVVADANSLASALDDLADEQEAVWQLANRYHLLVVLFRELPDQTTDAGYLQEATSVWQTFGFHETGVAAKYGWFISQMTRIASAWRYLDKDVFEPQVAPLDNNSDEVVDEHLCHLDLPIIRTRETIQNLPEEWDKQRDRMQAFLHLSAALFRVCLVADDDLDEPPSSFFNLNVQLSRTKSDYADKRLLNKLRVLAAGAGLWHALMATENPLQAFAAYNGFDCLVNLFGALTDAPYLIEGFQDAAAAVVGGALRYGSESDTRRLLNSLKELRIQPELTYQDSDTLRMNLNHLLAAIIEKGDFQQGNNFLRLFCKVGPGNFRKMAPYWAELFVPAMKSLFTEASYGCLVLVLEKLFKRINYLQGAESFDLWLSSGGREDGVSQIELLTKIGIKIPGSWQQAFLKYQDGPPESLASLVAKYAPKLFGGEGDV